MPEQQPVAVTGIGVVSPIGIGRTAFWEALRDGRSGIAPLEGWARSSGLPRIAAPVGEFAAKDLIASPQLRRMDRLSRMAVASSRLALDDAASRRPICPANGRRRFRHRAR
jgi:3-oxoacyl-[acyl-carrier-protein] synthase II